MSSYPSPHEPSSAASSSNTTLYILLAVGGGLLVLCAGGAIIFVICIAAITMLGANVSSTFSNVGPAVSPGNTNVAGREAVGIDLDGDPQAGETVRTFVNDLVAKRYAEAYQQTTADFQAKTSQQALQQLFEGNATLRTRNGLVSSFKPRRSGTATLRAYQVEFMDAAGGTASLTVEVTRRGGGSWQVNGLALP